MHILFSIDVCKLNSSLQSSVNRIGSDHSSLELKSYCELLNDVPLPAKVKNADKNAEQDIMKFLDNRLLNPLSQNIISEKLILMLLKIIISYGSVIDFFISLNSTLFFSF